MLLFFLGLLDWTEKLITGFIDTHWNKLSNRAYACIFQILVGLWYLVLDKPSFSGV